MYNLIYIRYGTEDSRGFETQAEALSFARGCIEANTAYPLDLFEDDKLLATNRDGSPLTDGTTLLLDMIDAGN